MTWFFCCVFLHAQTVNFRNYSVDDVLPSSNVYVAFQDSRGFVWFGTELGASRFDGNTFTHFSTKDGLSDNEVFNFFEDRDGRIWFQTMNGKISYYHNGEIFNSSVDTTLRPLDSNSYIASMSEDDQGAIWITTYTSGIVRYDKQHHVKRFFANKEFERIYGLFFQTENTVIVASTAGLFQVTFKPEFSDVASVTKIKIGEPSADHYPKYMETDDGEIIMKTNWEVSWYRLSEKTHGLIYETKKEDQVYSLSKDSESLWIGTGNGVLQYDIHDKTYHQTLLENHLVTSVLKDWEGNYWFTTLGEGVFFCTSLEMMSYTTKNGLLSDKVTCLTIDHQKRVWLGYNRGSARKNGGAISFIDNGKVNHYQLLEGKAFDRMITRRIRFNQKRAWVATNFGVFKVEGNNSFILPGYVRDVFEYSADSLWLGVGGLLCVLDSKTFERDKQEARLYRVDPLKDYITNARALNDDVDRIKSFFRDSNKKLWIGAEKKLYHYTNNALGTTEYNAIGVEAFVNDFDELEDKTIVLSTNGHGLSFLKDGRNVLTLGEEQGLSSSVCTSLTVDDDGVLWVATNKGVNKIEGYPDSLSITYFNSNDGLLSNEVTDIIIEGDTVWISTTKGINLFHKSIRKKTVAPRIFIDYVSVSGQPVALDEKPLELSYKENDLSIMYTGLSFNNGDAIIYRYKLHPEDDWRFTKATSVYLPKLSPDHYQFIVSAKGRSGEWSNDAVIAFVILKPFWKTTIFMVICGVVLAALIWLGTAFYFGQQKKEIQRQHQVTLSELKTLRAQMNPHFLFNALNSIQGVLLKNNLANTQDYLSRFGKLMRTILDHSDKSTISISEELESITNYLEIETLRMNYLFQYKIDIDPELDVHNTEIPAMMLQPFIENSIWHGFGQKTEQNFLLIKFSLQGNGAVMIMIEDNGIGRKKAMELRTKTHTSKGLNLVQERIDILNFGNSRKIQLTVSDLEDDKGTPLGTRVMLTIPPL